MSRGGISIRPRVAHSSAEHSGSPCAVVEHPAESCSATDAVYGPGHRGGSKADGPRLPTLPVGVIENRDAAYPTPFPLDVLFLM